MGRPGKRKRTTVNKDGWENITLRMSPEVGDALRFQTLRSREDMGVIADMILREALAEALRVLASSPVELPIKSVTSMSVPGSEASPLTVETFQRSNIETTIRKDVQNCESSLLFGVGTPISLAPSKEPIEPSGMRIIGAEA